MADPNLTVRELTTDADIAAAHAVMVQLRPNLPPGDAFVALVRRQQRDGYALLAGLADDRLVALAGIRPGHTLSRGPHLFVDDLITAADARGSGYGTAMLRAVAAYARSLGLTRVWLDSRDTARTFYEQVGFTIHPSLPCSSSVEALLGHDSE